jgi:Zn-dependent metalloprotease
MRHHQAEHRIVILLTLSMLLSAAPALAADSNTAAIRNRLAGDFGKSVVVKFDESGRPAISGISAFPKTSDAKLLSDKVFNILKRELWKDNNFALLETTTESSRFGSLSFSTIQLDGVPVIDEVLKVMTDPKGNLKTIDLTIPSRLDSLRKSNPLVSTTRATTTLQQAVYTICGFTAEHFDGYNCGTQAQKVWFMDETGTLAPGGRMLINHVGLTSMKEAVVDLRTGKLVRFVEKARR